LHVAASPENTIFLESVMTGQQGHDSEFIAKNIRCVFKLYSSTKFAGAVTDNTAANQRAWGLLNATHPSQFFHGCTSHGLHLLVKDIFSPSKTNKSGSTEATFPNGYPFLDLCMFIFILRGFDY
jgi:hypothetical protein